MSGLAWAGIIALGLVGLCLIPLLIEAGLLIVWYISGPALLIGGISLGGPFGGLMIIIGIFMLIIQFYGYYESSGAKKREYEYNMSVQREISEFRKERYLDNRGIEHSIEAESAPPPVNGQVHIDKLMARPRDSKNKQCLHCKRIIKRDATRCPHCWQIPSRR